jgi:hypothetical protein
LTLLAPQIARICLDALVGAGVAWDREQVRGALTAKGAPWGPLVDEFAQMYNETARGPGYLVGLFVAVHVREGHLSLEALRKRTVEPYSGSDEDENEIELRRDLGELGPRRIG